MEEAWAAMMKKASSRDRIPFKCVAWGASFTCEEG